MQRRLMTPVRALCLLALLWGSAATQASSYISAELREVVTDASTIVRGRVNDVRAVRSVAGDVESVVTIAVEAVIKGTPEAFVSMRVPGGTIGRYQTVMTGAPIMRVGERAVFFLKRGPGNVLWPVGLAQGVYRVTPAASGLGIVAAPIVPGVTADAAGPVVRGDVRRKPLSVTEFESLVKLVLAQGAAR